MPQNLPDKADSSAAAELLNQRQQRARAAATMGPVSSIAVAIGCVILLVPRPAGEMLQGFLLLMRTAAALLLVAAFIGSCWLAVWKLVLVHVPLVQEMFGLKKKPQRKPQPPILRFSRIYKSSSSSSHSPPPSPS